MFLEVTNDREREILIAVDKIVSVVEDPPSNDMGMAVIVSLVNGDRVRLKESLDRFMVRLEEVGAL